MQGFKPTGRRARRRLALIVGTLVLGAVACSAAPAAAQATGLKGMWGPAFRNGQSLFPTYRALGIGVYQDVLRWNLIARRAPHHSTDPKDPHYVWPKEVARAIAEANHYGMQVALEIIGTPRWANGGRRPNWAPRYPGNFSNFALAAAR